MQVAVIQYLLPSFLFPISLPAGGSVDKGPRLGLSKMKPETLSLRTTRKGVELRECSVSGDRQETTLVPASRGGGSTPTAVPEVRSRTLSCKSAHVL